MSAPKWTPGAWKIGFRKDGSAWMSVGDPINGPHKQFDIGLRKGEDEAEAAIIEYSQELYEALEWLLGQFGYTDYISKDDRQKDPDVIKYRAALAKARGES